VNGNVEKRGLASAMGKVIFSINVTIDGFADHTAGIADDGLHVFFADLLERVDTILFGRKTYQLLESYWPTAAEDHDCTAGELQFADRINSMSKIVFSNTLNEAKWNNTRLLRDDAVKTVQKLREQGGQTFAISSLNIASALTDARLIDEYWLLIHPVILGKGRPLFSGLNNRINLKLVETKTLKSGVVALHYLAGL
jgi:dihydrofolate reductase